MKEFHFPRSEEEREKFKLIFVFGTILITGKYSFPWDSFNQKRIHDFLKKSKFRNIQEKEGIFSAERGSKIWSYIGGVDPRRSFNSLKFVKTEEGFFISIKCHFYGGFASTLDIETFETEIDIFIKFLESGKWDDFPLRELGRRRRRVDLIGSLLMVGVFILLGIGLVLKLGAKLGLFRLLFGNLF